MQRPHNRLGLTLAPKALIAFLVVLLPIIVTFALIYRSSAEHLRKSVLNDLHTLAHAYKGQVRMYLKYVGGRVESFSSDGLIKSELDRISYGSGSQKLSRHLSANKLPLDNSLRGIDVLNARGQIVASTSVNRVGLDMSKEPFFTKGFKGLSVTEHSVDKTRTHELVASAPVIDRGTGKVVGVVANHMLFSGLSELLVGPDRGRYPGYASAEGAYKTVVTYLVNNDGYFLTESLFIKDAPLKVRASTEPVLRCQGSVSATTGIYDDYRGVQVAGASACIDEMGWAIIVEVGTGEVLAPLSDMKRNAAISAIVVAILMGGLVYFYRKGVVGRIKDISDAAKKVRAGNLDVSLPVKGTDELGALTLAFNSMIAELKDRTAQLEKSEERLNKAQSIAQVGSWDWDITTAGIVWSDEVYRIFGLVPQGTKATYAAFLGFVHPDDRAMVQSEVELAVRNEKPYSIDHRIVLADGEQRVVYEQGEVFFGSDGAPVRMIGTVMDVTERRRMESELKKLTMAIEHSVNLVFITDLQGRIEYVNPVFEQVTGYSKVEIMGQTPRILSSGQTNDATYTQLWTTILSGKTWRSTIRNRTKSGGYYWCNSVISPIRDDSGRITNFLAVQEDITEKVLVEERIERLASHDDVTGLLNRSRFLESVDSWLFLAPEGESATLFIIDIDQFMLFNSTYGQGSGDEYLRRLADLLSTKIRNAHVGMDTASSVPLAGRLGGDEFAVFLPGTSALEGFALAESVRGAVETLTMGESFATLTVSIGLVTIPEDGRTSKDLFTRADAAMFRAKELGRNRVHRHMAGEMTVEQMNSRLAWKEKITRALTDDRFVPWLQPLLDLKDNRIHHYEALARMRDIDGQILLPGTFISVAERFGLIGAIDKKIIGKVMELQAGLDKKGVEASFGMNLSGKDLGAPDMLDFIKESVSTTGARPSSLIFEITETAAIGDMQCASGFIRSLKELGFKFALDDFGVGFTSFVYLKELQVDFIKIDGSFIRRLHENRDDQIFVKSMAEVAKGLGIMSIAEFVEKEETLQILRDLGVDFAQGYFVGKPAPVSNIAALSGAHGKPVE